MYGDKGKQWLIRLPHLVKDLAHKWDLENLKPFEDLSYNYVLSGFCKKQPVVLKVSPDSTRLKREAAALKVFAGQGAVSILRETEDALLLEQAIPGTSLKNHFPHKDQEAVEIVCHIMNKLYQSPLPEKGQFPTIKDWLSALERGQGIPLTYLQKARVLKEKLLGSTAEFRLLHGDLHHYNILANGGDWRVIDPQGVIGEPAYEVAVFIRNPIPNLLDSPQALHIITQRIALFARLLKIEEERILQWCFVQAVLGWIWALEDGIDVSYFKRLTHMLGRAFF